MNRSRMISKINCQMNSNGTELCVNAGMVNKEWVTELDSEEEISGL